MQGDAAPLVVRCGAMGDMVILLSLTEALHRRFGRPVDVLTSGGWSRPLLEGQPSIGRVLVVGSRKTPYVFSPVQREIVAGLRALGPRPVWIYDEGPFAPRLLRRAGIGPDWCLQVHRDCPFLDGEQHVDRLLRFAQLTPRAIATQGKALDEASLRELRVPPLCVLPESSADVQAWLRDLGLADSRLYLVQAGNKRTMRWWAPRGRSSNTKYWPEDRWASVIQALLRDDPDARVILLGVPAEAPLNDTIGRLADSDRVVNAANALPMRRLLALQARACGMISVDTGPAHSGGALGCPLVVLFGEANVTRYTPRSPTGRVAVLVNAAGPGGMVGISVDEVLQAWRRVMEAPAPV
jgi:heptosyltransferase-2/heptosyltransferase-3